MQEQEKRKLEEKASGVSVWHREESQYTVRAVGNLRFTRGGFPSFACWKVLLATVQKTRGDQGDYGLQRPVSCLDYESKSGEREIIEEV